MTDWVAATHRDLAKLDRETLLRVAQLYAEAQKAILAQVDSLAKRVQRARERGEDVSLATVLMLERYEALREQVKAALERVERELQKLGEQQAGEAVRTAARHQRTAPEVEGSFKLLDLPALQALTRSWKPESIASLQRAHAEAVLEIERALTAAIATGQGPRFLERRIRELLGATFHRAQTIARTEVIRAYREASWALLKHNEGVVKGWRWVAALSPRTCPACLAMHGEIFPVDRRLHDHPNGRCAVQPVTVDWSELGLAKEPGPGVEVPSRDAWFWRQPREQRVKLLGPLRYEAFRSGYLSWRDMAGVRDSPWGPQVYLRPVRWKVYNERTQRWLKQRLAEVQVRVARDPVYAAWLDRLEQVAGLLRVMGFDVHAESVAGWFGDLEFTDEPSFYAAYHRGQQTILINPKNITPGDPRSFHIVVHEMLHAYSVKQRGYSMSAIGFEEGVVEQVARMLRPELAKQLGIEPESEELRRWLERHPYNRYVQYLEEMRKLTGRTPEEFYFALLRRSADLRYYDIEEWAVKRTKTITAEDRVRAKVRKLKTKIEVEALIQGVLYG